MKRFLLLGAVAISLSGCVSDEPRYGGGYDRDVYRPRPVAGYRERYREPPIYRDDRPSYRGPYRDPYRDPYQDARRDRFDDDRRYDRRDDDRRYERRDDAGRGEGRRSDDPRIENRGGQRPGPGRPIDAPASGGVIVNPRQPAQTQPDCVQGLFNHCPGGVSPIDRGGGN